MNIRVYSITVIIAFVLSIITYFFDYRISLGILLTSAYSIFNLLLLSLSMKAVLKKDDPSGYSILMGVNIVRFSLLAVVIYIAIKNPQIFNIFGVTAGLILFLFALLIDALTRKGN